MDAWPGEFHPALVHEMPSPVLVLDLQGRVVWGNPEALRLLGVHDVEELVATDLVPPESAPLLRSFLSSVVEGDVERIVYRGPAP